jgi:hypothetical protein
MKKQMKKLVLAKETIRGLETGHLIEVAGGSSTTYVPTYGSCGARFCDWEPDQPSC